MTNGTSLIILSPGRRATRVDDYSVIIACNGCGDHVPISRTDDQVLSNTDMAEALTTWTHDCPTTKETQ